MDLKPYCPICWEVLFLDESAAICCGHTFHQRCILKWVESYGSCPICRKKDTAPGFIRRLFFHMEKERDSISDKLALVEILLKFIISNLGYDTTKIAANAVDKANLHLAEYLSLKEKLTNLESVFRHNVLEMEALECMLTKKLAIEDDPQKQLQPAVLEAKVATKMTSRKRKFQKVRKTIVGEKKSKNKCNFTALTKERGYPPETVMSGAHGEITASSLMKEAGRKKESQASIKDDTEEAFAPPIIQNCATTILSHETLKHDQIAEKVNHDVMK